MNYKKLLFLRNLSTILIPFLIPLVLLGALSFVISGNLLQQRNDAEISTLATNARARLDYPFMDIDGLIRTFDASPSTINSVSSVLNKESYSLDEVRSLNSLLSSLNSILNTKNYFQSIYVYYDNPYGKFLSLANGIVSMDDFWDFEWFELFESSSQDSGFYTKARTIKQAKYDPYGVDVITIIAKTSSIKGCLVFNLKYSYFQEVCQDLMNSNSFGLVIFDGTGQKLFPNDGFSEALSQVTAKEGTISIDGMTYLVGEESSAYSDWTYFIMLSTSSVHRFMHVIYTIILAMIITSCVVGVLIAAHISKKNSMWIQDIIDLLHRTDNFKSSPSKSNDLYSEIVHNIIQVFMETQYLRAERKSLELTALQAQINPHFLYNTLNCIYWETIRIGNGKSNASDMIEELSDILEYSISNPLEKVSLEDEIEYTKDYISIQQYRFPDSFDVEWLVDSEASTAKVMKLLLQPLVENSISHGFRGINRKGVIKITVRKEDEGLTISVADNGSGIPSEKLYSLQKMVEQKGSLDSNGIGLNNTVKRLSVAYGDNCSFMIDSEVNVGTTVTIVIEGEA